MYKESISVQELCDFLNRLIKVNQHAVNTLFTFRAEGPPAVSIYPHDEYPIKSITGYVIKSPFGRNEETGKESICFERDIKTMDIIKFKPNFDTKNLTLYEDEE